MNEARIEAALLAAVPENDGCRQIGCAEAQELADSLGVPPRAVAFACKRLGILLIGCRLLCPDDDKACE